MPKQGVAFTFYTELVDAADTTLFKSNPTIAAGDAQISLAGGAFANLTNLPTVTPAGGTQVKVELTTAEMVGADRTVQFHDVVGGEWLDQAIHITADVQVIDDLATQASVDALNDLSAAEVNAEVVDALATDVIADSIPAAGSRPTIAQALYMLVQYMNERSVSATTVTVKKEDGSTSLYTLTLDDASDPTAVTRAS